MGEARVFDPDKRHDFRSKTLRWDTTTYAWCTCGEWTGTALSLDEGDLFKAWFRNHLRGEEEDPIAHLSD